MFTAFQYCDTLTWILFLNFRTEHLHATEIRGEHDHALLWILSPQFAVPSRTLSDLVNKAHISCRGELCHIDQFWAGESSIIGMNSSGCFRRRRLFFDATPMTRGGARAETHGSSTK